MANETTLKKVDGVFYYYFTENEFRDNNKR